MSELMIIKMIRESKIIAKIFGFIRRHTKILKAALVICMVVYLEVPILMWIQQKFKPLLMNLYLSPGAVIKNTFTEETMIGLIKMNAILLAVFAFILLMIWTQRMTNGQSSDYSSVSSFLKGPKEKKIDFSKTNGTYGTAQWMDSETLKSDELKPYLRVSDVKHARGIILGYYRGTNQVISIPKDSRYNRNIAVPGSSGSMKSRSFVLPNILNLTLSGESMVVTDPKGELLRTTYSFLVKEGYTVRALNLVNPECSDRWNILKSVTDDVSAITFANTIMENVTSDDPFWDKGQRNLLKALALYITMEEKDRPERMNMSELYNFLTQKDAFSIMVDTFAGLPPEHPAVQPFNIFLESAKNEKVGAGMISGLATNLQLFQSKKFRMLTEGDDIDLALPGRKKCAYFVVLPDSHSSFDFMAGLFFSFAFQQLTFEADRRITGKLPIQVNFIMDEFPNVAKIPDVNKKISTIRSRGINMFIIYQNIAQLQNRYPNGVWEEILSGCDNTVFLACNENTTAEYISKTLGTSTVEDTGENKDKYSMGFNAKESKKYTKRNLLNPDEVKRLNPMYSIVMPKGQYPIPTEKMDYTKHPLAKKLKDTPIEDMLKDWSQEFHEEWLAKLEQEKEEADKIDKANEADKNISNKNKNKDKQHSFFKSITEKVNSCIKSSVGEKIKEENTCETEYTASTENSIDADVINNIDEKDAVYKDDVKSSTDIDTKTVDSVTEEKLKDSENTTQEIQDKHQEESIHEDETERIQDEDHADTEKADIENNNNNNDDSKKIKNNSLNILIQKAEQRKDEISNSDNNSDEESKKEAEELNKHSDSDSENNNNNNNTAKKEANTNSLNINWKVQNHKIN